MRKCVRKTTLFIKLQTFVIIQQPATYIFPTDVQEYQDYKTVYSCCCDIRRPLTTCDEAQRVRLAQKCVG